MKASVVFHGDCDGVIAAYLYIKRFYRDLYPHGLNLVVTHPWRAHIDVGRLGASAEELVILDIALSDKLVDTLKSISTRCKKVAYVDHHETSGSLIPKIEPYAKVIYAQVSSTPRLLTQLFGAPLNPYESALVEAADICEGRAPAPNTDRSILEIVDSVRMSVAINPGDLDFMRYLIDLMIKARNIPQDPLVKLRTRRAKFLLNSLLKVLSEDSLDVGRIKMTFLDLPMSRAFAGIIGIAATELSKAYRKGVVLIREEQDKVVITVRSARKDALELSKQIADSLRGVYGGHAEASSITIPREPVGNIVGKILSGVLGVENSP